MTDEPSEPAAPTEVDATTATVSEPLPLRPPITCAGCGAPIDGDQGWCTECGLAARTRIADTPNWRLPLIIAGALGVAAIVALVVAFVVLTGDNAPLPQTTPTAAAPADTVPTTSVPAATTPTTTTPVPTTPVATTPTVPTTTTSTTTPTAPAATTTPVATPTSTTVTPGGGTPAPVPND